MTILLTFVGFWIGWLASCTFINRTSHLPVHLITGICGAILMYAYRTGNL